MASILVRWLFAGLHGGTSEPLALAASGRRLLGEDLSSGEMALYICVSIFLVIFAGLMSGLTLGLLSLGEEMCLKQRRARALHLAPSWAPSHPLHPLAATPANADPMGLEVVKRSGTERERWLVSRVEPVLTNPHWLLATLLLCNAIAMVRARACGAGPAAAASPTRRWIRLQQTLVHQLPPAASCPACHRCRRRCLCSLTSLWTPSPQS